MEKMNVRTIYPDNPCDSYKEWMEHIQTNLRILRTKINAYTRLEDDNLLS